jgi:hypothetical protein
MPEDAKIEATTASNDTTSNDKINTTKKKLPYPRMQLSASQEDESEDHKNTKNNHSNKQ